jgi:thiol-disulfide isomerase/thioredoxin
LEHFSFSDINGQKFQTQDLKGKILVFNVWASWCGTCMSERADLNKLHEKYKDDRDVMFFAFSDESAAGVMTSLRAHPFYYRQVAEAEELTDKLQSRLVKTFPQNLIVDQNSIVVFDVSDGTMDLFQKMDSKIKGLKKNN